MKSLVVAITSKDHTYTQKKTKKKTMVRVSGGDGRLLREIGTAESGGSTVIDWGIWLNCAALAALTPGSSEPTCCWEYWAGRHRVDSLQVTHGWRCHSNLAGRCHSRGQRCCGSSPGGEKWVKVHLSQESKSISLRMQFQRRVYAVCAMIKIPQQDCAVLLSHLRRKIKK